MLYADTLVDKADVGSVLQGLTSSEGGWPRGCCSRTTEMKLPPQYPLSTHCTMNHSSRTPVRVISQDLGQGSQHQLGPRNHLRLENFL